ncbi:MAG: shikimate dehydrogenase [Sulfuricella sp.]|nr:shikimate dehydrogenase [Sulfuricella sp.]
MTDRYAVVGNPISHSKSPLIHAAFARQTGQDLIYETLLAPLDGFAECVDEFRSAGGKGLNVTVPFKVEAWQLATRLSERARLAQAVNTLHFGESAEIFGDNTDGAGLVRDIVHNLGCPLEGKKILLMGAGGAARGVLLPLLEKNPASVFIVNRTDAKAVELQAQFAAYGGVEAGSYDTLPGRSFDAVINATSSGLADELPPLPPGLFAAGSLAYDMMYGRQTPFMAFAREQGAQVVADGLGMLVEQAAESFLLWRGVRPDTQPVMAMLRG